MRMHGAGGAIALQLAQTLHLSRQITGEVPLHYAPRLGIGGEIPLQRSNLPPHCADSFHCHCIHVRRDATKDEGGAYDITSNQFSEDASISRHPHFPANDEQDGIGKFAALYQPFSSLRCDPRAKAQNLQDLPWR